jgi:hypothetical protein
MLGPELLTKLVFLNTAGSTDSSKRKAFCVSNMGTTHACISALHTRPLTPPLFHTQAATGWMNGLTTVAHLSKWQRSIRVASCRRPATPGVQHTVDVATVRHV